MFVLHVDLEVKAGARSALEEAYLETFRPAICGQEGFRAVELLRTTGDEAQYRLSIAFDTQSLQQKWVATDLHQQVWPLIEQLCAHYSLKSYDTV